MEKNLEKNIYIHTYIYKTESLCYSFPETNTTF